MQEPNKEKSRPKEIFKERDTLDISKIIEERIIQYGGTVVRYSKDEMQKCLKHQEECLK